MNFRDYSKSSQSSQWRKRKECCQFPPTALPPNLPHHLLLSLSAFLPSSLPCYFPSPSPCLPGYQRQVVPLPWIQLHLPSLLFQLKAVAQPCTQVKMTEAFRHPGCILILPVLHNTPWAPPGASCVQGPMRTPGRVRNPSLCLLMASIQLYGSGVSCHPTPLQVS